MGGVKGPTGEGQQRAEHAHLRRRRQKRHQRRPGARMPRENAPPQQERAAEQAELHRPIGQRTANGDLVDRRRVPNPDGRRMEGDERGKPDPPGAPLGKGERQKRRDDRDEHDMMRDAG
jgi:hypothetical protein